MNTLALAPDRAAAWRIQAAVTLAELAQSVADSDTDCPDYVVRAIVQVCCPHIEDEDGRMRLWGEYLHAVKQENAILNGLITWQEIDDTLTCRDRTQAAIDIAGERSVQALEDLTGRYA